MRVLVMIVVGVAIFAVGIAMVWLLLVRSSRFAVTTEEEFDDAYDELVAEGELIDRDRDAAWRDFHAWQLTNEKERLSWEEAPSARRACRWSRARSRAPVP
jgi:hypothetical protein